MGARAEEEAPLRLTERLGERRLGVPPLREERRVTGEALAAVRQGVEKVVDDGPRLGAEEGGSRSVARERRGDEERRPAGRRPGRAEERDVLRDEAAERGASDRDGGGRKVLGEPRRGPLRERGTRASRERDDRGANERFARLLAARGREDDPPSLAGGKGYPREVLRLVREGDDERRRRAERPGDDPGEECRERRERRRRLDEPRVGGGPDDRDRPRFDFPPRLSDDGGPGRRALRERRQEDREDRRERAAPPAPPGSRPPALRYTCDSSVHRGKYEARGRHPVRRPRPPGAARRRGGGCRLRRPPAP